MHPKVTARIDDSYTAYSHSVRTLEKYNDDNSDVGILAVVSQLLFPTFVTLYIFLFFCYVIELKPYNFRKITELELSSEVSSIKAGAQLKLLTNFTISILFHVLTLAADGAALSYYNPKSQGLSDNVKKYYTYKGSMNFWGVPIIMILFDTLTLILFIIIPFILSLSYKKYMLLYCLISPFSCLASHGYHIVFAFIHDPYHATSILLLYAIIVFVHIQGFQKLFFFIHSLDAWNKNLNNNYYESSIYVFCVCMLFRKCVKCCFKNIGICTTAIILYVIEFLFLSLSIGLSLALVILLPISNAIDDAPNRLYVIYQASVTFFAALIAFQLLFRQNKSILGVFIKALNSKDLQSSTQEDTKLEKLFNDEPNTDWIKMSEKEKEFYLAGLLLKKCIPECILMKRRSGSESATCTGCENNCNATQCTCHDWFPRQRIFS